MLAHEYYKDDVDQLVDVTRSTGGVEADVALASVLAHRSVAIWLPARSAPPLDPPVASRYARLGSRPAAAVGSDCAARAS